MTVFEKQLRDLVVRSPLADSRLLGAAYATVNRWRFRGRWQEPVAFRGARFVIGKDLSLYPFVRTGGFEEREFDAVLAQVAPDAVCWDVGANIGLWAVLLAGRASRGQVVAFEPVPSTLERLRANLALNGVENVVVEPVGLGEAEGVARVEVLRDQAGGNRLVSGGGGPQVRVTTADAYWRRTGRAPDVVKVDIEGYEPEFLRGAAAVLAAARPLLLLEVNGAAIGSDPARRRAWQEALDGLFALYGEGTWFGPDREQRVRALDVGALPPRACALVLGERR